MLSTSFLFTSSGCVLSTYKLVASLSFYKPVVFLVFCVFMLMRAVKNGDSGGDDEDAGEGCDEEIILR